MTSRTYWVETLGCPKNQVDSDKLIGTLTADGMVPATAPDEADLVVVNTCAFIEDAREESVNTILTLGENRREGAELVVTGCMSERYGEELAAAIPEADSVVGFGVPVTLGSKPKIPAFDLLELPRPPSSAPWAYVKIAEGCDRACGFCAIPTFRGPQRSRTIDSILREVDDLEAREIVLIAQDLAAYGRDQGVGERAIVPLIDQVAERVDRVRLLYLYPSDLNETLIDSICRTGVPYFDLSLQHVSPPLMRRMKRWGNGAKFIERIERIRTLEPDAAFRSNFIVGYPGETEEDHDALLDFVEEAQLDWCGFFKYSAEEGTYAYDLDDQVEPELAAERLYELNDMQDTITALKRDLLIGESVEVLVDSQGSGRSFREAPEIDGIITVPTEIKVGEIVQLTITGSLGPDLEAS